MALLASMQLPCIWEWEKGKGGRGERDVELTSNPTRNLLLFLFFEKHGASTRRCRCIKSLLLYPFLPVFSLFGPC